MSQPDNAITSAPTDRFRVVPSFAVGLTLVGLLWGISQILDRGAETPSRVAGAVMQALAIVAGSGLAGRWLDLTIADTTVRRRRMLRTEEARMALWGRAVTALEHLVEAIEKRPIVANADESAVDPERGQSIVAIGQALRESRWDDAEVLIDALSASHPDDPALAGFRERLDAARGESLRSNLERLDAARRVNDPDRVLELYQAIETIMDAERRAELGRDLARWFLELIHRRLRNVPIQADVVELANRVAEALSHTAEGASLRASLPMLRRSVGLCPRCAEPYRGTAAACPRCLGSPSTNAATTDTTVDAEPTVGDESDPDSPHVDGDGRDSGWVRYDEDDGDGPDPLA